MAVTSGREFLTILERSRLLSRDRAAALRDAAHESPRKLAEMLVAEGELTAWQAQQLLRGQWKLQLGKYRLLSKLGEGGMGAVFKALQTSVRRTVAVKMMSEDIVNQPGALARFQREIRAASALDHPNIVAALDADQFEKTYFFVMEYAEGRDLKAWLKEYGRLPIEWSCECIRQAALGLQHAHERGLAHRDIKPSNLLVIDDPAGGPPHVKILDMGLARFTSETQCTVLTQTGQVLGTIDYIAPEQAKDTKGAGIQADIFSLGASLFHLLTGQAPFGGRNPMEKLMARALEDAPRASTLRPDLPAALDDVIARMLERDPANRFAAPGEAARALAPFSLGTQDEAAQRSSSLVLPQILSESTVEPAADPTLDAFLGHISSETAEGKATESADAPGDFPQRPSRLRRWQWPAGVATGVLSLALAWLVLRPGPPAEESLARRTPATGGSTKGASEPPGQAIARGGPPVYLEIRDGPYVGGWHNLFNGRDLDGWQHGSTRIEVLHFEGEPVIGCKASTFGRLLYNEVRRDYHLRLEFRWGHSAPENRNSGIAYHVHGMQRHERTLEFGPKVQGAFWSFLQPVADPLPAAPFSYDSVDPRLIVPAGAAERPLGEWNTAELICVGAATIHAINGKPRLLLANQRTLPDGKPVEQGKFALEFNGASVPAEIMFRNVQIRRLRALPEPYAAEFRRAPAPSEPPDLSDPADSPRWRDTVSKLPAGHQLAAVWDKLDKLNPGFDWSGNYKIEDGKVVRFQANTGRVANLLPVAALRHLKNVDLRPGDSGPESRFKDLSPLGELPLESLYCPKNPIVDLTPIRGLKLKALDIAGTHVVDLTPIAGMPLEELRCDEALARKNEALIRGIRTLKILNRSPADKFWTAPPDRK